MIDLSKSSFLLPDLTSIISNLSSLNKIDTTLNKITLALSHFTSNPKEVNPDELKGALEVAKSIAESYDREGKSIVQSINRLFEEIDHLALSASILTKSELFHNLNIFYKLAKSL